MPLGSLLGPLEALLGGLKSEKMPTVPRENQFLVMQFFGFLKLLMALFGYLGPFWVDLVPNVVSKMISKVW